ncbi:unnamed protein product [Caenorhabditis angaria]|uniref:Arrestin C-terminal-like domain-containing protein n=1 Tax=Caenorhabditis angaria TaxID=860376 RepID=A0A9P1MY24_9PELO|nr:unnamed protein product [Caenorhabditis angaria]
MVKLKQKRALRILLPDRPLRAGHKELIELCLKIPDAVQIVESKAVFEGRCRASFSGQDSVNVLADEKLTIPFEQVSLPTSKGFDVIPEGSHRLPIFLQVPPNLPGTFQAKWGAIVYRLVFKIKIKRFTSGDEGTIECEKNCEVFGKVALQQQPSYAKSVNLERHVKKKIFFVNRLDATLKIELERAAFLVGEYILVSGKIENHHSNIPIKRIGIEIRQHLIYASGDAQKIDSRLMSKQIIGSVPVNGQFQIHHSLKIPHDCYPSLVLNGSPIQVTYEILLVHSGHFEVGVPIFIGNCGATPNRHSILGAESVSTVYCVPPSEFSVGGGESQAATSPPPPPYSTFGRPDPIFIPIHMLKTPYRPFGPPNYHHHPNYDQNFNNLKSHSPPPPPRFIKIEEIVDDE